MKKRVYLRALELDDYKTTIKWRRDEEIWQMVGGPKYFVSTEYEKNWIAKAINHPVELRLGICLVDDDKLIGLASMINVDLLNRSAEFSLMIGEKEYWNGGYGTEAGNMLLDYCVLERGMYRLSCTILESNLASQKIALNSGFTKEGVLRSSVYKDGRYHNQVIFSILRDEYLNIRKTARDK